MAGARSRGESSITEPPLYRLQNTVSALVWALRLPRVVLLSPFASLHLGRAMYPLRAVTAAMVATLFLLAGCDSPSTAPDVSSFEPSFSHLGDLGSGTVLPMRGKSAIHQRVTASSRYQRKPVTTLPCVRTGRSPAGDWTILGKSAKHPPVMISLRYPPERHTASPCGRTALLPPGVTTMLSAALRSATTS